MNRFRWLGLLAAAALGTTLFALTAGIGSARTTAAPSNTTPPKISGTAQVGQMLSADNGTWNGTTPFTYTYQWRLCDANGASCQNIPGATGNQYMVKSGDQDNSIRVVVTAKNAEGSASSTSVPTAKIGAAAAPPTSTTTTTTPTASSNGCPKLAAGATSASVSDFAAQARLQIDKIQTSPGVITRGTGAFQVKVHVSSTCGTAVQGADVYATGVPFGMITSGHATSDASGNVSFDLKTLGGFPATPRQQLLVMFIRAAKPGDNVLAGISTRRLVSFRVNLHG
jgi:hypothetical protein